MSERMSLADRTRRHRLLSNVVKPGAETPVSLSDLPDDLPLTLKEACERVFGGSITVASLKAEYARGNLELSKIGRTYITTPADLKAMFVKCRVTPQKWVAAPPRGGPNQAKQSDEADAKAALAWARLTVEELKAGRKKSDRPSRNPGAVFLSLARKARHRTRD